MKILYKFFSGIRLIPHIVLFSLSSNKDTIQHDISRWLRIKNIKKNGVFGLIELMTFFPEYRNLFYHRIGEVSTFVCWLCPKMNTLFIHTNKIGPGLFIQHGFATIISAKSIGKDCWINQQVTIGYSNATDCPTIEDNVTINAGAKIIGKVNLGTGAIVGANGVVVKDIPENCTVVGIPGYIVRRNGLRVNEKL